MSLRACQRPPGDWITWGTSQYDLGVLPAYRAEQLESILKNCRFNQDTLIWDVDALTVAARSELMQAALVRCRELQILSGWRNEPFDYWTNDDGVNLPSTPFLTVERAGFRFLGMRSHAVHINGFLADGRVWCGRRSPHKPTDPGLLDNMSAGGLTSGESIAGCARRELYEEAGFELTDPDQLLYRGRVHVCSTSPQGWHDEILHVFNLHLNDNFLPANQDGEVSEFLCLNPDVLVQKIEAGEFTQDASLALVEGLRPQLWDV